MPTSSNNKAFLTTEDNQRIPCLFNPSDLSLTQMNGWAADPMPGKGVPTLRYTGAGSGSLRLTLFFDTTDTGRAVTKYTSKIVGLMELNSSLPGSNASTNNIRPPWVVFHWGDFHSFKAVVSALELTFEYFSNTGTAAAGPSRAHADPVPGRHGVRAAEPDLGHAAAPPGSPGAAGRDARPHLGSAPGRLDPVAAASPRRTASRTRSPSVPAACWRIPEQTA